MDGITIINQLPKFEFNYLKDYMHYEEVYVELLNKSQKFNNETLFLFEKFHKSNCLKKIYYLCKAIYRENVKLPKLYKINPEDKISIPEDTFIKMCKTVIAQKIILGNELDSIFERKEFKLFNELYSKTNEKNYYLAVLLAYKYIPNSFFNWKTIYEPTIDNFNKELEKFDIGINRITNFVNNLNNKNYYISSI